MKEHVLNPSNRAALQGLITLAGAVGIGALLTCFFVPREDRSRAKTGLVMFELFVVATILAAAAATAFICISLLHENKPVSNGELTEASIPLVVSVVALVLLSMLSRLPDSPRQLLTLAPVALVGVFVAALLGSQTWMVSPGDALWVALAFFALGGVLGGLGFLMEAWGSTSQRNAERADRIRLARAGYQLSEENLELAVPQVRGMPAWPRLACWRRGELAYLDLAALRRLERELAELCDAVVAGEALPPIGTRVLAKIEVRRRIPLSRPSAYAIVTVDTFQGAREAATTVRKVWDNGDGLYEVSALGFVPRQRGDVFVDVDGEAR
jgi:hypothetical protein